MVWLRAGITLAAVLATAFWQRDIGVKTHDPHDHSGLTKEHLASSQRRLDAGHPAAPPTRSLLEEPASKGLALALASTAWLVPALMSSSTAPSPNHPRILLWYKSLRQPPWKPPDLAIPLAWFGIETCLAAAAYRLLRRHGSPPRNRALGWLATNVVSIGGWSWLFFGRRNLAVSTLASAGLLGTSVAYVAAARKEDPTAAAQGLPLVAWVAFATVLTASIWRRNR
jgi:benzodiazapine receptor